MTRGWERGRALLIRLGLVVGGIAAGLPLGIGVGREWEGALWVAGAGWALLGGAVGWWAREATLVRSVRQASVEDFQRRKGHLFDRNDR